MGPLVDVLLNVARMAPLLQPGCQPHHIDLGSWQLNRGHVLAEAIQDMVDARAHKLVHEVNGIQSVVNDDPHALADVNHLLKVDKLLVAREILALQDFLALGLQNNVPESTVRCIEQGLVQGVKKDEFEDAVNLN